MYTAEDVWFLVGIGGFLVFLEGVIVYVVTKFEISKKLKISGIEVESLAKVVAGLIIFMLALVNLF